MCIRDSSTPLLLKMDEDVVSAINVRENLIDRMEVEISNYLIKMTDQELGDDESHCLLYTSRCV